MAALPAVELTPVATARAVRPARTVSTGALLVYALPVLPVGLMWNTVGFYFLKYATDVLLIAPATVGLIFAASRVWDAVSDPMAGYWSDRTRSRLGRRRPWLLASAAPAAAFFVAMWAPPTGLGVAAKVLWTGAAIFVFYTALTAFRIPHLSLGAELVTDYHGRTRVFAFAGVAEGIGALSGLAALALVIEDPTRMPQVAGVIGLAAFFAVLVCVWRVREPAENQGRGGSHPLQSLRDVRANPHACLWLAATIAQEGGLVCLMSSVPFVAEYVLGDPGLMVPLMLAFLIPAVAVTPVSPAISRRFGKKRTMIAARALEGACFGALYWLAAEGAIWPILSLVALAGAADGCSGLVSRSIQADIIDYDEACTGERKEGTYFAAWNLGTKLALALGVAVVGVVLGAAGFEPGQAQSPESVLAIRTLVSGGPVVGIGIGLALLARFRFGEREHAEAMATLRGPGPGRL